MISDIRVLRQKIFVTFNYLACKEVRQGLRKMSFKKRCKKILLSIIKFISLIFFARKFKTPIQKNNIHKILYICLAERGDIVITSAAIRRIKNSYPSCEIFYLSQKKYIDVARCLPGISSFMGVDLDSRNILFQFIQYAKLIKNLRSNLNCRELIIKQ